MNLRLFGKPGANTSSHPIQQLNLFLVRNNILRSSKRLRDIISSPAFVKLFGEAKPNPKGGRRNVFGFEDELKTAPKGINKAHKFVNILHPH